MSTSRIDSSRYGGFKSRRPVVCVLLVALCLLVFPSEPARTSGNTTDHSIAEGAYRSQGNDVSQRFGNLTQRIAITQLPETDGGAHDSVSMASGDFDEDGVLDLVVGSIGGPNPFLSVYRGNQDSLFPDNPQARQRKAIDKLSDSSVLTLAGSFPLGGAPDFLVSGDFNGDGHLDVVTAARNDDALYLSLGDGRSHFSAPQRIQLSGRMTALTSSGSDAAHGLPSLAIGIVDGSGPSALIFTSLAEGTPGPKTIRLPAPATAIAFIGSSLAIAAGRELLLVPSDSREIKATVDSIQHRFFSSEIRSIAKGNFIGNRSADVAVLTADGVVSLLTETESGDLAKESLDLGSWPLSTQLVSARISGSEADDLVLNDPGNHRLLVLLHDSMIRGRIPASIDIAGEPIALLPMRLHESALSDLVLLRAGQVTVTSLRTLAAMTFTVNNTSDSGGGSLRQAILDANANPGADTINFNIPGPAPHTIIPLSPLPAITEAVTINGTSQPDFAGLPVVELNGLSAGVSDGLDINASSCDIRGLAINRFSGSGIVVTGNGNIIEGNFIGTNPNGTFAVGNAQDGVFISGGTGNTIGGTTSAASNVISGNRNGVQIFGVGTSGNQVRGNFIGTNSGETASLGNSVNGVLISGSSGNAIGAAGSASGNTIAFNGAAGVAVAAGTGNSILSNSIFLNGGLGIDLFPAGVTPNDPGDGDSGANTLQNFPVLTSASAAGTSTTVQGTLNSTANTTFTLEFFSSQFPNPSGFGEGQNFIGAVIVNTNGAGDASFNPTFAVTVPPGQVITATATNPSNNTSEFSRAIQVGGQSGGTPADLSVITSIAPNPVETGSQVTKTIVVTNAGPATATSVSVMDVLSANTTFVSCDSTGGGVCGGSGQTRTITFAAIPPGTTAIITIVAQVNCSVANGTIIGNTATVFSSSTPDPNPNNNVASATTTASNPAPRITCPANIVQANDTGRCGGTVNYQVLVVDNCPGTNVFCSPPSGSTFAIGTSTVTCLATDAGGATASCSFTVTVNDTEPLVLLCPGNVTVTASPGQCSPVVGFPAPTVLDNCPGATVRCVPPSGSSFPLGVTNVTCTGTDARGAVATCGFIVTVNGSPQAVLRLEGNGPTLDFGPVAAARKIKKLKKQPARNFTVENTGCITLVLTLDSISRTGEDVNRGFITNPDDRNLFALSLVSSAGVETPLDVLTDVTILPGQKQNFKVRFNPLIPAVAKGTRGLSADQVVPDLITSTLTFTQNGGAPISISLVGHVDTALILIDPVNPRNHPFASISRVEDDFIIEYSIYDSNLDVNKATYQFFDKRQRPAEQPIAVDLSALIRQTGFVKGQSFTISQRFSGAKNHPEIAGVEVTVFDSETSVAITPTSTVGTTSVHAQSERKVIGTALFAPELALPERKRSAH